MGVTREQVFRALFGLAAGAQWLPDPDDDIEALESFVTMERKLRLFSDVPNNEQPYMAQTEHGETVVKETRLPYKRVWEAQWVIYHKAGAQPNVEPVVLTNQIIDAIEKVMAPKTTDPGFLDKRNTLSGLVHHCFIEGAVFKDPGDIDEQAMIVIPIKLLVP